MLWSFPSPPARILDELIDDMRIRRVDEDEPRVGAGRNWGAAPAAAIVLLTPEEVDEAVKLSPTFRPPAADSGRSSRPTAPRPRPVGSAGHPAEMPTASGHVPHAYLIAGAARWQPPAKPRPQGLFFIVSSMHQDARAQPSLGIRGWSVSKPAAVTHCLHVQPNGAVIYSGERRPAPDPARRARL